MPAGETNWRERIYKDIPHRLLSLHGSYLKAAQEFVNEVQQVRDTDDMELMLDSGAFTAWSKGEPAPNVYELLKLYKRVLAYCGPKFKAVWFISLDCIPGSPGRTATAEEMKEAIRISDQNHEILAGELGDCVLPVFHQSEELDRLHEVIEINPSYICVSPRNDLGEVHRVLWSQRTHQAIPRATATHGLAATGSEMLTTTPWHSVDSAAWIQSAAFGNVLLWQNGATRIVPISEHHSERRTLNRHYDTMHPAVRKAIAEQCAALDVDPAVLRTEHGAREFFNVHTLRRICEEPLRNVLVPQTLLAL